MTETREATPLSPADTERYHRDGYLEWRKPVFWPEQFARLSALFEELLERYGADDLDVIHVREPRLLEYLMADEVLDLVQPLVGPDIGIWSSPFYFTLAPGECSLHDARIVHGADANRSDRRRAGYTMRYFPTTSKLLPKNGNHPVWLARGRDRAGNRYVNA